MLNFLQSHNLYPISYGTIAETGDLVSIIPDNDDLDSTGLFRVNSVTVAHTGTGIAYMSLQISNPNTSASLNYIYKNYYISGTTSYILSRKNNPLVIDLNSESLAAEASGSKLFFHVNADLIETGIVKTETGTAVWFDKIEPSETDNIVPSGSGYKLQFNVYSSNSGDMNLFIDVVNSSGTALESGCFTSATGCTVSDGYTYTLSGVFDYEYIRAEARLELQNDSAVSNLVRNFTLFQPNRNT